MSVQYLIVPGYGDSNAQHWQTYFEHQLPNARRVVQKDWEHPICTDWVQAIDEAVAACSDSDVILIGHSLGCIAIVHWAQQSAVPIRGALLVAPADLENPHEDLPLNGFTPIPLHSLPFPSLVVASSNDSWAAPERSRFFAEKWGSDFLTLENAGHINSDAGYGDWPAGLQLLGSFFDLISIIK
ncbi:MAG: serine hydrolase family protein [Saprospiraceae bacterium]|nr:serine hydrolase family protein [Saprospiraceae bacterium]